MHECQASIREWRFPSSSVSRALLALAITVAINCPAQSDEPRNRVEVFREIESQLSAGEISANDKAALFLSRGQLHFKAADFALAEKDFRECVALQTVHLSDALWYLARTLISQKRIAASEETVRQLELLNDNPTRTRLTRAALLCRMRKFDQAEAITTELLDKHPNLGYAYYMRGLARLLKGSSADALKDFEAALLIDGDEFEISKASLLLAKSDALQLLGHRSESKQAIEEALKLDPTSFDAVVRLWMCQVRDGDQESAVVTAEKALRLAPDDSRSIRMATKSYFETRNYRRAEELSKRWLSIEPKNGEALRVLCRSLSECGNGSAALEVLNSVGNIESTAIWIQEERLLLYATCEETFDLVEAINIAERVAKNKDLDAYGWMACGTAFAVAGKHSKAEECFAKSESALLNELDPQVSRYVKDYIRGVRALMADEE